MLTFLFSCDLASELIAAVKEQFRLKMVFFQIITKVLFFDLTIKHIAFMYTVF